MNRQTVLLLLIVFTFSANADTISKQSFSLSPSTLTANVPSILASEPQIPSNNKPQPFKGPTLETLPTIQPAILNATVELKPTEQISKKQESSTSLNSTTTIEEEITKTVVAKVLKVNATDSLKKPKQTITVTDTKVSKGETNVKVLEKNDKLLSNEEKLQRQAIQQKKARQILSQSNTTEMVKAVPDKTASLNEKLKSIDKVTVKTTEISNSSGANDVKKDLSESKDKKSVENSIVTTKIVKQEAADIKKTPQQVIVVNIIDAEANNKTVVQQDTQEMDQLQVQNKTQAHQETTTKRETVKQKQQSSNEIKIIPLDTEQDQQTQETDEDGEQQEQVQKPLPKKPEEKVQKTLIAPILKKDALQKEEKTATTKKVEPEELEKPTVAQQKSIKKQQIKKEPIDQTKKATNINQKENKQRNDEKTIPQKKQAPKLNQIGKDKQQTSKPKEYVKDVSTQLKEKSVEDKNQAIQLKGEAINPPKAAKQVDKPVTQSPKSEIVKPSDKANKPEEHTTNLRRQKQPEKTVLEKDINEVAQQPQKKEQQQQKTNNIEKQQTKLKQGSLQQLLEEVKSDLNNDAKTKIIQHLENQIKEQEEKKIAIFEDKPEIQKNQYLQLQSSPHLDVPQPDKEEEVSSEEIMDSKTVIVIIILTFIISIPIVREIKSKDSEVKASKDKMENDLKESSQTLGLEFSELDNETGYGQPLDQEER